MIWWIKVSQKYQHCKCLVEAHSDCWFASSFLQRSLSREMSIKFAELRRTPTDAVAGALKRGGAWRRWLRPVVRSESLRAAAAEASPCDDVVFKRSTVGHPSSRNRRRRQSRKGKESRPDVESGGQGRHPGSGALPVTISLAQFCRWELHTLFRRVSPIIHWSTAEHRNVFRRTAIVLRPRQTPTTMELMDWHSMKGLTSAAAAAAAVKASPTDFYRTPCSFQLPRMMFSPSSGIHGIAIDSIHCRPRQLAMLSLQF